MAEHEKSLAQHPPPTYDGRRQHQAEDRTFPVGIAMQGKQGATTDYGITTVDREIIISGTAWPGYETPLTTTLAQAGISVLDGELRLGVYKSQLRHRLNY